MAKFCLETIVTSSCAVCATLEDVDLEQTEKEIYPYIKADSIGLLSGANLQNV